MSVQQRNPVQPGLDRCPFCHESVERERVAEWVACSGCLARHHEACWGEGGACAACGDATPLWPRQAVAEGAAVGGRVPVGEDQDALEAARQETAQLLDREAGDGAGVGVLAGSALALWLLPVGYGELALRRHRRRNAERVDPSQQLPAKWQRQVEQARAEAFPSGLPVAGFARASLGLLVAIASLLAAASFGQAVSTLWDPWYSVWHGSPWPSAFVMQALLTAAMFLHAGLFREAVARHERRQAFASLVSAAVPADGARELLGRTRRAWSRRRAVDAALMLLSLIPGLGIALCVIAGIRQRGALALHEEHEELFEAAAREAGVTTAPGGKQAAPAADPQAEETA